MIEELKKRAEKLKISDFGIVKAEVFDDLCLTLHSKKGVGLDKAEKMSNPFLIMPEAKSIIVCIFSYKTEKTGNISKYAMGMDYHQVIKQKLSEFVKPITKKGYICECYADSWDLDERYLAVKAGLGFIGENGLFISPKYGSFVFIGAVLTDCPLIAGVPITATCKNCGECIRNCPGGALSKTDEFDCTKCLSAITQKKGELSEAEISLIKKGGKIWGCDRCQEVCPHNKNAPDTEIEEFSTNLITDLVLNKDMSNREFKKKYAERAFSWRGITPLIRNQDILNSQKI